MPNSATISGIFLDADKAPVAGGKVVATFVGTDSFEDGVRIVTHTVDATTDATGAWSMDLIVNGEGRNASSSWTVTGYSPDVVKVFEIKGIFIPVAIDALLDDLEATSATNIKAAKDASLVRLITAGSYAEYLALPAAQRRDNDHVLIVTGG